MYAKVASVITEPAHLSAAQQVQLRQYWNEINQFPPGSSNHKVIAAYRDINILLSPPQPAPINVFSRSSSKGLKTYGVYCSKQTREDLLQMFITFHIPIPLGASSLPPDKLCQLLAVSWPHGCLNGWQPSRFIGKGHEGSVYAVCQLDNCTAVAKLEKQTPAFNLKRECVIQRHVSQVAPRVLDYFICSTVKPVWEVLVMEQYDGNLKKSVLTRANVGAVMSSLLQLIRIMNSLGVTHRDLHTGNILYRATADGRLQLAITDFGFAYMESLGAQNKDVSMYQRYIPAGQNMYYDLAYLLISLRSDTGWLDLHWDLEDREKTLVDMEISAIMKSFRNDSTGSTPPVYMSPAAYLKEDLDEAGYKEDLPSEDTDEAGYI